MIHVADRLLDGTRVDQTGLQAIGRHAGNWYSNATDLFDITGLMAATKDLSRSFPAVVGVATAEQSPTEPGEGLDCASLMIDAAAFRCWREGESLGQWSIWCSPPRDCRCSPMRQGGSPGVSARRTGRHPSG